MDCSPPGSSVHGILQAGTLEWVAMPFSRDLPSPRMEPGSAALRRVFFTIWATRESLEESSVLDKARQWRQPGRKAWLTWLPFLNSCQPTCSLHYLHFPLSHSGSPDWLAQLQTRTAGSPACTHLLQGPEHSAASLPGPKEARLCRPHTTGDLPTTCYCDHVLGLIRLFWSECSKEETKPIFITLKKKKRQSICPPPSQILGIHTRSLPKTHWRLAWRTLPCSEGDLLKHCICWQLSPSSSIGWKLTLYGGGWGLPRLYYS